MIREYILGPLELEFCTRSQTWVYLQSSPCRHVRPAPFVEDAFFFPIVPFWFLYQRLGIHRCVDLYLRVQSIPLIDMSVFILILFRFYDCSFVVQLEIKDGDTSEVFIVRIVLAIVFFSI